MRNKDFLLLILIIAVVVVISITFKNSVRDLKNYIVSEIPILKDKVDDMIEERVEEELEEREKERKSDIMNKLAEYKDTIKEKLFGYKNDLDKTIDEKINEKIKEYKSENDDDNDGDEDIVDSSEDLPNIPIEQQTDETVQDLKPLNTISTDQLNNKLKTISEMTRIKNDIEGVYDNGDTGYYYI